MGLEEIYIGKPRIFFTTYSTGGFRAAAIDHYIISRYLCQNRKATEIIRYIENFGKTFADYVQDKNRISLTSTDD